MTDTMFLVCNGDLDYYATVHNGYVDYSGYLYNDKKENLTIEQYVIAKNKKLELDRERLKDYPDILKTVSSNITSWKLYDSDEFIKLHNEHQRAKYLTGAIIISKEEYNEKLEVLPPLNWNNSGVISSFFMSEFLTGSITAQYGFMSTPKGKIYLVKNVDYRDKSTWLNTADFVQAANEKE